MSRSQRKANPEEPDSSIAELRELVREAHAAIRDLSLMLREAKQLLSSTAPQIVDKAMEEKVNAEITKLNDFLAGEAKRASNQMTIEIAKAREWIMQNLELIAVTETPDGLRAEFNRKDRTD